MGFRTLDSVHRLVKPSEITQVVTIDGPAGAGKSTVARELAKRLGYAYLDTGAMYRAATWWALENEVAETDQDGLIANTRSMPLEMRWADAVFRVAIDGNDITEAIRTPEVTEHIRYLAAIPEVREHLVALQRDYAADRPIVTEGRDQGSVVFPAARCKIYLDASLSERARRRAQDYAKLQVQVSAEELEASIAQRDKTDADRETAPLIAADDAVVVDTTGLSLDEVVERVLSLVHDRLD